MNTQDFLQDIKKINKTPKKSNRGLEKFILIYYKIIYLAVHVYFINSIEMTLLVSLTVLFHRKCDLLKCNKESPLWKVFRGCSHSFHIECVLPDISVCKICESTLKKKIESLGKVANDAVFHHNLRETVDDEGQESDEESETDDGTEDDDADELGFNRGRRSMN